MFYLCAFSVAARRQRARLERLGPVGQMHGQVRWRRATKVTVLQQPAAAGGPRLRRVFRGVRDMQSETVHGDR